MSETYYMFCTGAERQLLREALHALLTAAKSTQANAKHLTPQGRRQLRAHVANIAALERRVSDVQPAPATKGSASARVPYPDPTPSERITYPTRPKR